MRAVNVIHLTTQVDGSFQRSVDLYLRSTRGIADEANGSLEITDFNRRGCRRWLLRRMGKGRKSLHRGAGHNRHSSLVRVILVHDGTKSISSTAFLSSGCMLNADKQSTKLLHHWFRFQVRGTRGVDPALLFPVVIDRRFQLIETPDACKVVYMGDFTHIQRTRNVGSGTKLTTSDPAGHIVLCCALELGVKENSRVCWFGKTVT